MPKRWRAAPFPVFVPRGIELSAAQAAWLWSGWRGVVAGQSAAALLGTKWIDGSEPAELIYDNRKSPKLLVVRDEELAVDESFGVGTMRLTSAARTAFDLGRHMVSRFRSVQRLVFGDYGEFIARVDMSYEEVRVGIEYDGPQHWDDYATRQRDVDKQVEFADVRWHIIRVGRDLLQYRRPTSVHRVASALRARGLTW